MAKGRRSDHFVAVSSSSRIKSLTQTQRCRTRIGCGAPRTRLTGINLSNLMNNLHSRRIIPAIALGVALSRILILSASAGCVPPPSGLVSWWQGEGNASDRAGTNNGTITGNVTFGPGLVGQAFVSDGVNGSAVQVGTAVGLRLQNFTI